MRTVRKYWGKIGDGQLTAVILPRQAMSREVRLVAEGVPHDITRRGNSRQNVFLLDEDQRFYIETLRATYSGQPFGNDEFVDEMERRLSRRLRPKPPGPTPKAKDASARST